MQGHPERVPPLTTVIGLSQAATVTYMLGRFREFLAQ